MPMLPLPARAIQQFICELYFDISKKIDINRRVSEALEELARELSSSRGSWTSIPVRAKAAGRQPKGMDARPQRSFPAAS